MKDTKFIELLNLYLDHQISETESAQLEAEIRSNPARYRLYRQYCQMQKGCTLLTEKFCAEAPAKASVAPAGRSQRSAVAYYYAAGLAAAACVALLVVTRPAGTNAGPALAASNPSDVRPVMPAPARPTVAEPQEMRTVFTTQALAQLEAPAEGSALFTAAGPTSFDWMNEVRLHPVQSVPVVFESAPDRTPERDAFRSRRPFQATVEMTAYQFQK